MENGVRQQLQSELNLTNSRGSSSGTADGTVSRLDGRDVPRAPWKSSPYAAILVAPMALAAAASLGCDPGWVTGCVNPDPPESVARDLGPGPETCVETQPGVTRFVALGDGGTGALQQFSVAAAMRNVCCEIGCDFALYLGDNFYDVGVQSVDDEQFQTKFEQPYADIHMPFYVVAGNHDYGGPLGAPFWNVVHYQVEYSDRSEKWTMPAPHYTFNRNNITFAGLNTNAIMWGESVSEQEAMVDGAVAGSPGWTIAFGHHPYISNGEHGDAGFYETGVANPSARDTLPTPILGGNMKRFVESHLCGNVDLYFSGHDHNRQWLPEVCGTQFVVTGAAGKLTQFREVPLGGGDRHDNEWQDDTLGGFFWGEIEGDTLNARFYDETGTLNFERTITRPSSR
jgi:hypothetical protein